MKSTNVLLLTAAIAFVVMLPGCSKGGGDADDKAPKDRAAGGPDKAAAAETEKAGVTLDAETQERIGLKTETPVAAQWTPGVPVTGRVVNPFTFISAVTDYETARSASAATQVELERTKKLAAQENASPRVLEAAQTSAIHDTLAVQAAQAKFAGDWGTKLAAETNLAAYAEQIQNGSRSLVKVTLPAGTFPDPLPQTATLSLLGHETNVVEAEFADNLFVDPATQTQMLLFTTRQKLPPEVAVEGRLNLPGEPVNGVVIPFAAVLRYQGGGWAYIRTATNQFQRVQVPTDRLLKNGWFVSQTISATNQIVVVGAQSVLSAEMSNGGFGTGERD